MTFDLLDLTAQLVDIPSESHHEAAITDHIAEVLAQQAPHLELTRVGENLVARSHLGRAYRLLLAGHTDTVPVNGNLPSRLDGDTLWGCGSSDMKSGIAVMLALACQVPNPLIDVTYVFYAAEEVAEAHNGLGQLFRERPDLLVGDVALLGEPTSGHIEAGCQGTLRAQVTFAGQRAHTARPWMGRNAIHRMAGVLALLAAYEAREPIVDGCQFREAMQAVKVEGGVAGNVVPDRVVLTINHRFAPDRSLDEAVAHVQSYLAGELGPDDRFELVDAALAAVPGLSHPVLTSLIARSTLSVGAKLGWTDVARFSAHGIPATNFGPGDPTLAHTAQENVEREPTERVYRSLHQLLTQGVCSETP
jgi:succinyl-diaminopimelate desuccinylase